MGVAALVAIFTVFLGKTPLFKGCKILSKIFSALFSVNLCLFLHFYSASKITNFINRIRTQFMLLLTITIFCSNFFWEVIGFLHFYIYFNC